MIPTPAIEPKDGGFTVWADFRGVDRPRTYGIATRTLRDAQRVARAMSAGVFFTFVHIATDVNGQTYVAGVPQAFGRHLNADLRRLGF